MNNECLVSRTRERIKKCDYEAVFASGCCFHFALRLHEKFNYTIRGIREGHDVKHFSHVWCQIPTNGEGVDIRGVYPECLLVRLANGGKPAEAHDVPIDEVRDAIRARGYPLDLEREILELADWIIDIHERFEKCRAKPLDATVCDQVVKNIENGKNSQPTT